jgi:small-conductance mechanosensitive channel
MLPAGLNRVAFAFFNILPSDSSLDRCRICRKPLAHWCVPSLLPYHYFLNSYTQISRFMSFIYAQDGLIVVIALIILFFIALGVFNIDVTQSLTTFYSLGLAAGFIFKNTAQVLFDSIIFLFVTHAFDSGDRIVLSTLLGRENSRSIYENRDGARLTSATTDS